MYSAHGILGAPAKDQVNLTRAKVADAEIDSSEQTLRQGIAAVSAPAEKICMSFACHDRCSMALPPGGLGKQIGPD